jgi:Phage integrase family
MQYVAMRATAGLCSVQHLWSAIGWVFDATLQKMERTGQRTTTQYASRVNARPQRTNLVDVEAILQYLEEQPDRADEPRWIRRKAIILLTISLGARGADLATIRRDGISFSENGEMKVRFGVRKQDRGKRHSFGEKTVRPLRKQALCAVNALQQWLRVSDSTQHAKLFTTLPGARGPVRALKPDTINSERTRFLREQMNWQEATSHQLKAAVISWWKNHGVSDDQVRRRLDATSMEVIYRHYDRHDDGDPSSGIIDV